jgi:hypothetical protein
MRIALKYGLPVTLIVIIWVVFARFLFPIAPESGLQFLAPVLFNIAEFIAIYLGIRAAGRAVGEMSFKASLKVGVSIAFVYAASSCLFFVVLYLIVGPKLLLSEPMAQNYPLWQVALGAYAGLFFGALILGLIYSAVVSFLLARRST